MTPVELKLIDAVATMASLAYWKESLHCGGDYDGGPNACSQCEFHRFCAASAEYESLKKSLTRPDFLSKALNEGDGTYRP